MVILKKEFNILKKTIIKTLSFGWKFYIIWRHRIFKIKIIKKTKKKSYLINKKNLFMKYLRIVNSKYWNCIKIKILPGSFKKDILYHNKKTKMKLLRARQFLRKDNFLDMKLIIIKSKNFSKIIKRQKKIHN